MADEKKSGELRVRPKGNIFLEIGIVVMLGILIWSLVTPMLEREQQNKLLKITRAKMKVLFQLEYQYLYVDTTYTTDLTKLTQFAKSADETMVPDSLFLPLQRAYMRLEDRKAELENMSLSDFKKAYIDSLPINSLSGQPFIVELVTKSGRRTFNLKPSTNEDEIKWIGSVVEGEIQWDEKAELAN